MLTRSAEYAVRALSFLALQPEPGSSFRSREIAAELDLPAPFLAKVLRQLAEAGILSSTRGRSGGFQLEHAPEDITLESIVKIFQPLVEDLRCPLGYQDCGQRDGCPMHHEWTRIRGTTRELYRRTSLADVAPRARVSLARPSSAPGRSANSRSTSDDCEHHDGL